MLVVAIYLIIVYKLPFIIFFITLAMRDTFLIIIGVYLILSQEEVFQSNISGKWFVGISTLMMAFFIFQNPLNIPEYLLWLSYVVSVILFFISTYEYILRYRRYFKQLNAK
jgi:phosphatidylglycerophosphate synthase